jgi:hypothetical protein
MSNGRRDRRSGGQKLQVGAALLFFLTAGPPAFAQVGHEPQRSPFRDVTTTQGFTLLFGRFAGARTEPPVGARPGSVFSLRLETRLSGPLDLYVTWSSASSSRNQVFPQDDPDSVSSRVRGPIDMRLGTIDLALILNITGAKRWHRLSPYAGVGFGITQASPGTVDQGGFKIGSNFVMMPTLGTKIFLSRSLALRLEARDHMLRYEWPLSYFTPVDSSGTAITVLPISASTRQLTHNFTLSAGLTYLFTF